MTENDALEIIKSVLKSVKNITEVNIDKTTNIESTFSLDSLDSMLVLMELTDNYGINIPDEHLIKDGYYNNVDKLIKIMVPQEANDKTKI